MTARIQVERVSPDHVCDWDWEGDRFSLCSLDPVVEVTLPGMGTFYFCQKHARKMQRAYRDAADKLVILLDGRG